jgi:hypothetical protein
LCATCPCINYALGCSGGGGGGGCSLSIGAHPAVVLRCRFHSCWAHKKAAVRTERVHKAMGKKCFSQKASSRYVDLRIVMQLVFSKFDALNNNFISSLYIEN